MRLLISLILITVTISASRAPERQSNFRILVLVPYPGKSHWLIFRPLIEALAERGNDVTVVSHHPREKPIPHYRDISLLSPLSVSVHSKDVNTIGMKSRLTEMNVVLTTGVEDVCRGTLSHPNVKKLLESNDTYDLLITEIFNTDCYLGFVHKFRAPFIAIRTAPLSPWTNDRVGNPDNPSYVPNSLFGKPSRMHFWDRFENVFATIMYKWLYASYNVECTKIARKYFGNDMPDLMEIALNTSLILVNSHYVLQYARPLVPGIKEVGGIHIQPNKSLPQDIEDWINGSKHGVIYFSLGSMLKSSSMSDSKRKAFFEAFAELPHRVLMKWENTTNFDLPKNVKIFEWAPQYDILCHPNVKLFISHAGMLSTMEGVYSGTPMIAIPAFGDQPTNAALLQEKGFAIVLEYADITKDALLKAFKKILYGKTYETKAKEMSFAIRDRLVSPVDEAVYWTEYVARHGGAPFLRSPALDLPLYQYLLLDVIGTLIFALIIVLYLLWLIIRTINRQISRPEKEIEESKPKTN